MRSVLDTNPTVGCALEPREYDHETAQVARMHGKFDLGHSRVPQQLDDQKMAERLECLSEELSELAAAFMNDDLPGMSDALVDLVVFAKGTAVLMGIPWAALFDDVMRANMAKVRGVGPRGHAVDLVKPEGWRGPETERILREHGWASASRAGGGDE